MPARVSKVYVFWEPYLMMKVRDLLLLQRTPREIAQALKRSNSHLTEIGITGMIGRVFGRTRELSNGQINKAYDRWFLFYKDQAARKKILAQRGRAGQKVRAQKYPQKELDAMFKPFFSLGPKALWTRLNANPEQRRRFLEERNAAISKAKQRKKLGKKTAFRKP
ncbi:MAG: hypothetical protein Q7S92_04755 [Candidatus Diapherotrites archaeon]|nr:hypothetical protein [Candidatus Diapherotrites archaeon]